jgi:SRSO17 transposase
LEEFVRAATMRWPIEQCFETGKSHLGMDHYEHRSWPAWRRHMT